MGLSAAVKRKGKQMGSSVNKLINVTGSDHHVRQMLVGISPGNAVNNAVHIHDRRHTDSNNRHTKSFT